MSNGQSKYRKQQPPSERIFEIPKWATHLTIETGAARQGLAVGITFIGPKEESKLSDRVEEVKAERRSTPPHTKKLCDYCDKQGHLAAECFARMDDKAKHEYYANHHAQQVAKRTAPQPSIHDIEDILKAKPVESQPEP